MIMFETVYLFTFLFLLSLAIRMVTMVREIDIIDPSKRKPIHNERDQ